MSKDTPEPESAPSSGFVLDSKLYDRLKFVVQVILPGLGTLYAGLGGFWNFPNVPQVIGSITAVALFLGLLLAQSSKNFTPPIPEAVEGQPVGGFVVTTKDDGTTLYTLSLTSDPASFADQDTISFNVIREENSP